MEVNKGNLLDEIAQRLEAEATDIQTILNSGQCSGGQIRQLRARLTEVIKQLARAQSAISTHTVKNEQLAKLTATAQSAGDIDKAKELVIKTIVENLKD